MSSPSYSSSNPASYTRAILGSPISSRPGSFNNGNRYFPGSSPNQLLDPTDLREAGNISSSASTDRGSIMNALSAMEHEDELCRNYTCCGLNLQDLHALIEHFGECHVVVDDPCTQPVPGQTYPHNFSALPANPMFDSNLPDSAQVPRPQPQHQQPLPQLQPRHHEHPQQQHQQGPFDPDDMELDMDSSPASSTASFASPVAAHGRSQARYHPLSAQVSALASASPSTSPSRAFTLHADTTLSRRQAERRLRPFADDAGDCRWRYKNMDGRRYPVDHGAVGLKSLPSGRHKFLKHSKSAAPTYQPFAMCSSTRSLTSSPTKSTGSQSWHYPQGFGRSQYSPCDIVNTQPPSTQGHVSTSQSSPSCILVPPENLHPTLSCWIKNMKKLSSLIDRLQELAPSVPTEHQSQLLGQLKALRVTSKKQQEQFMDFLQLSEEYANEYLLDIDAYIQQQSSFLAELERRLEAAKKLRGEAAELQMLYESGTLATMKNLRATALPRPLPEDHALFREVDSVLAEIKQCYTELYKFWTEEISRAMEAFEKRRVNTTDFDRWRNFHANLKQTIESWKGELPSDDAQTVLRNNAFLSREADIGTIASSLSFAMSSVTSALERVPSTNSLKYLSSCQSSIQRVYLALRGNRDACLSFLRHCADYGEKVIGCRLSSTAFPTPFRVMASHDLRERTMRPLSETTNVSVENAASVQGSRKFKAAYKKARSLEETTTSGLNTLLGSWTAVTDGHAFPDDDIPDVITPKQLRELWEKARYSVRAALANLRDEPAPQLLYRSAPLESTRLQTAMKRWMMKLVFFS
ncbi:hypothetical protein V8E52_007563 [Russula decolorans]